MRTQLFGLLFLGITSLIHAQKSIGTDVDAKSVNLKDVIISSNSQYINKVYEDQSSEAVKNLEQMVAGFDLMSHKSYSPQFDIYLVNFITNGNTKISAVYDSSGIVLSSNEQYADVLLPHPLRQALVKEYSGWTLHSNSYKVKYDHRRNIKKFYRIQMIKDGAKKNLKIIVDQNQSLASIDYD